MSPAPRRRGGGLALVALLCAGVRLAAAQDSQFGIRGLGTPGRGESVRARGSGGAFAPFDPLSPLADAALADLPRLTATAAGATHYRRAEFAGATREFRTSRFPLMALAGPVARGLVVGGGFTTYLDRSFSVVTQDTVVLRGTPQPFTDEIASNGGVSDLRLAVAARVHRKLAVGAGFHVLAGSTRATSSRVFEDSTTYSNARQVDVVQYDGLGFSASALVSLPADLQLVGYFRSDTRLQAEAEGAAPSRADLPTTLGGAVSWLPSPSARFAGGAAWRSWGDVGAGAFDTFGWSAGAELGSPALPLRFGVRGGRMPFGSGSRAPTEWGVSAGTRRRFAGGRGLVDVAVERLERKGSGLTERVWTVLVGITLLP